MGVGLKLYERCPFGLLARVADYGGEWTGCNGLGFTSESTSIPHSELGDRSPSSTSALSYA